MTNPKAHKPNGGNHDVIRPPHAPDAHKRESSGSQPRRTDAALKPRAPLEVLISRALDQELAWYFTYAEAAVSRQDVGMLPSYAAARVLAADTSDEGCRAKALELGRAVASCLASLREPHASVLRTAYTPRRWPASVEAAFQSVAPIAVRIALGEAPWPPRKSRKGLEEAAAGRLAAALVAMSPKLHVSQLRAKAERLLGHAIVAYTKARALDGAALGIA